MLDMPALPTELTIYTVSECASQWASWLDDLEPHAEVLCIDASAVGDVDGAGVQLLVALANALRQRQHGLRLLRPTVALGSACQRLGAAFLLAEPLIQEPVA